MKNSGGTTRPDIGQMMAYKAKFLKDICDFSASSANKRGLVLSVEDYGSGFILVYLGGDFEGRPCNLNNICLVNSAAFGDS